MYIYMQYHKMSLYIFVGLSSLTESAGVTTNPDRLRFDYPLDDGDESVKTKARKPPPTVYREQVNMDEEWMDAWMDGCMDV